MKIPEMWILLPRRKKNLLKVDTNKKESTYIFEML
jgi:hypothetical protein